MTQTVNIAEAMFTAWRPDIVSPIVNVNIGILDMVCGSKNLKRVSHSLNVSAAQVSWFAIRLEYSAQGIMGTSY